MDTWFLRPAAVLAMPWTRRSPDCVCARSALTLLGAGQRRKRRTARPFAGVCHPAFRDLAGLPGMLADLRFHLSLPLISSYVFSRFGGTETELADFIRRAKASMSAGSFEAEQAGD